MSGILDQPLKPLIQQLIRDTISEQYTAQGQAPNEQGTVSNVNDDGTVDVTTMSGATYTSCGTPVQRTLGEIVTVITADNLKVVV